MLTLFLLAAGSIDGGLLESDLSLGEDATIDGRSGEESDVGLGEDDTLEVGSRADSDGVGDLPEDV